jgi:pyruvate,orthophosphate dikinase
VISQRKDLEKIDGIDLNSISVQKVSTENPSLAKGGSASTGVIVGKVAFSSRKAKRYAPDTSESVILVQEIPSPGDISGIDVLAGFMTASGGARTARAAVVACQLGKVCIVKN